MIPQSQSSHLPSSSSPPIDEILADALHPQLRSKYVVEGQYTAILNQTNIQTNTNKFYIMQVLRSNDASFKDYRLGKRFGRVGERGNVTLDVHPNLYSAISAFKKMYQSKTGNKWDVHPFTPKKGKYILLETVEEEDVEITPSSKMVSSLDPKIYSFLQVIANRDMMNIAVTKMNFDLEKLPLGKISKKQLKLAHGILKEISYFLADDAVTNIKAYGIDDARGYIGENIADLSSKYWTLIPHATKRNKPPPLIDTLKSVETQSNNLETLYNIGVFGRIKGHGEDFLEKVYTEMKVKLVHVIEGTPSHTFINNYIKNSCSHGYGLSIDKLFAVEKSYSEACDDQFNLTPNHVLLFHGSKLANFVGILTEGLRIPQSTQVINGSVLGLGIYFANCVTKSFNYCGANYAGDKGVILICEVALGNTQKVTQATFSPAPPAPHTSVSALGQTTLGTSALTVSVPTSQHNYTIPSNILAPPTNTHVQPPVYFPGSISEDGSSDVRLVPSPHTSSGFLYDEFVIFNTSHYRIRWIAELTRV